MAKSESTAVGIRSIICEINLSALEIRGQVTKGPQERFPKGPKDHNKASFCAPARIVHEGISEAHALKLSVRS